ncbi:MAG: hypothetical protein COZ25_07390 [Ignavibacteria bacterium CG_4_10_14_3_um_filter_37_18]|nr:MAG: hypothetical protein COZ25_07390 [Ignavibacteria bacterium CG_4_10_14_3_um_filter_37_18]
METPNQNEEPTGNPDEGGESEEQKEFNKLFEGVNLDDENADVEELKKKVENIQKGAAKFFSEKGMKKGVPKEEASKPVAKQENASDLEVIFFESKPEASLVEDDLKAVAKAKGISLIQAWKQESWIQTKAKALQEEKSENDGNSKKVGEPSGSIPAEKDSEQKAIERAFTSNLPSGFSAEKPKM